MLVGTEIISALICSRPASPERAEPIAWANAVALADDDGPPLRTPPPRPDRNVPPLMRYAPPTRTGRGYRPRTSRIIRRDLGLAFVYSKLDPDEVLLTAPLQVVIKDWGPSPF